MNLSEQEILIERARRDPEAFGELYDQFYSQIFGYVLKRVANIEIAQDITSEVFFKALKNLGKYQKRNKVPFSSWLYRIATNNINDYFRKKKHSVLPLEEISDMISTFNNSAEAEVLQAEEELMRQEDFLILHECISKLPIKYQEVITLRFFEKKQDKEIAQILGKPEGTVKSLLHRGLGKLREMIG
jgi:RNA polymerase sigma-70 factor (ECF subfamily)